MPSIHEPFFSGFNRYNMCTSSKLHVCSLQCMPQPVRMQLLHCSYSRHDSVEQLITGLCCQVQLLLHRYRKWHPQVRDRGRKVLLYYSSREVINVLIIQKIAEEYFLYHLSSLLNCLCYLQSCLKKKHRICLLKIFS